MIEITTLPHILAGVNTTTVGLLLAGFYFIRTDQRARHMAVMKAALGAAVVFLVIYVYYHLNAGLRNLVAQGLFGRFISPS